MTLNPDIMLWKLKADAERARAEAAEKERDEFRAALDRGPAASVEAQAEIKHWRERAEAAEKRAEKLTAGLQVLSTTFYKGDQHQDYAKHVLAAPSDFMSVPAADVVLSLKARAEAAEKALREIATECSTFPIKNGLAFRCESIARAALGAKP